MNLLYINWDVDPEIINILGFSIKYYGLLFMTGLLLCYFILRKIYKNENLSSQAHEAIIVYGIVGILLGARLGHCLFYDFEYYSKIHSKYYCLYKKARTGVIILRELRDWQVTAEQWD